MTDKFPKWLPNEVKEHAKRLIEVGGLNTAKPLLMRLTTHSEMEKVWKTLATKTDNPQKLIDFLEFVRLHPTLRGEATDPIRIPSDKVQRAAFNKVSAASLHIIAVLSDLSPSGDAQYGWDLLSSALTRLELYEAEQASMTQLLEITQLQSRLNDVQQQSVISLLETIALAAKIAATAPDHTLPKRRHSPRAKCNKLIMDLKYPLKHQFYDETADTLIAATVNSAFDFPDGGISADDVRKLKT